MTDPRHPPLRNSAWVLISAVTGAAALAAVVAGVWLVWQSSSAVPKRNPVAVPGEDPAAAAATFAKEARALSPPERPPAPAAQSEPAASRRERASAPPPRPPRRAAPNGRTRAAVGRRLDTR